MQSLETKSSRRRPKSFETETRPETFETETETTKNGSRDTSRDRDQVSRLHHCSRHLQSFKSVLQKLFVSLALKKCAPNEPPALQAHLDLAGKVLDDPPTFLPWDRSWCYCDCCLQVRDNLEVVAMHPVLKVSPHIKSEGFKSGECGDHCGSQLRLISRSGKRCCNHANDSFEVWGVAPSCWNHWKALTTPLCRPSAVQNLPSTWTYRSVLIVTDCSLSSSNQNGPVMICLEMATQAVHFTECNGLCRQCSEGALPQKMLFLEFM